MPFPGSWRPAGSAGRSLYTCHLLRTLGNLLESGVPLLEALDSTRLTLNNAYYRDFVNDIALHVREGGRLSRAFTNNPYIMDSVKQMVDTGEETGNLYPVMLRLANYYDLKVNRELKTMAAVVEQVALIVLGGLVAMIVSGVIRPRPKSLAVSDFAKSLGILNRR